VAARRRSATGHEPGRGSDELRPPRYDLRARICASREAIDAGIEADAARFSRSQRAVEPRASAITKAVATTNATAVTVSHITTGSPPVRPQVFRLPVVPGGRTTISLTGASNK